jgi:serine/threonine protein kinase
VGGQPPLPQFGRYETTGILGRGAFGTVYAAIDPALDSGVAIKVLADNFSTDAETRQRFIKEARFLRRIGTDRLVGVYDIGEREGQPYFVMELLGSGTLTDRMEARDTPLTRADLRRMTQELAAAMSAIHRAGVIHRDIKPSNLLIHSDAAPVAGDLLSDDERIVLGDFGLARDIDASALTVAGGTDGFMSPEQRVPGAPVDERSDIYAATAVIAELAKRCDDPLPAALQQALDAGLQPDPDDRPADVDAWQALMLDALVDGPATSPVPVVPPPPPATVAPPGTTSAPSPQQPVGASPVLSTPGQSAPGQPARGAPWLVPVGVVLSLVVLAVLALVGRNLLAGGDDAGPGIIGPNEIEVGETATYLADERDDAGYYWTDWEGIRHDGSVLDVEASTVGVLPITLTEVRDGVETSRELVVRVVPR